MIRLKLFGFPIRVHFMFLVMLVLVPFRLSVTGQGEQDFNQKMIFGAGWVLIGLLTIIWHELGHAFSRKKHGAPHSEIALGAIKQGPFIGFCAGPGEFTRSQSLKISLAGPINNLIVAALVYPIKFTPLMDYPYVSGFWQIILFCNLVWGLINLAPLLPFDGGRVLTLIMNGQRPALLQVFGIIIGLMAVVLAVITHRYAGVILFATVVYENWVLLRRGNR